VQEASHFCLIAHQFRVPTLDRLKEFDHGVSSVDLEGTVLGVGVRNLLRSRIGAGGEDFQQVRHSRFRGTIEANLGIGVRHCSLELLDDRVGIVLEIDDPRIRTARFGHLCRRILEICHLCPRAWGDDFGKDEGVAETAVETKSDVPGDFDVLSLVFPDRNLMSVVEQDVCRLQGWVGEQSCGHEIGFTLGSLVLELRHSAQFPEGDGALHEPGQL